MSAHERAMARMGWNLASPTNELRVSLLAYLHAEKRRLSEPSAYRGAWWEYDGLAIAAEIGNLDRWIAWLEGAEVKVSTP